jgi:hypothetical protein
MRPGILEVVSVAPIARPSVDTHSRHTLGPGGGFCENLEHRTMSTNLMSEEFLISRFQTDRMRTEDLQRDTSCTARLRGNCGMSAWTNSDGNVHPGPRPD